MTDNKNFLFDEEAFMKKAAARVSQKKGIMNGEDDAFEKLDLNARVIEHLERKFLSFLAGESLPF